MLLCKTPYRDQLMCLANGFDPPRPPQINVDREETGDTRQHEYLTSKKDVNEETAEKPDPGIGLMVVIHEFIVLSVYLFL